MEARRILFAVVFSEMFMRIMRMKQAFEVWDFPKKDLRRK